MEQLQSINQSVFWNPSSTLTCFIKRKVGQVPNLAQYSCGQHTHLFYQSIDVADSVVPLCTLEIVPLGSWLPEGFFASLVFGGLLNDVLLTHINDLNLPVQFTSWIKNNKGVLC